MSNTELNELQIRLQRIKSEPNGIVRETMIDNFLIDMDVNHHPLSPEDIERAASKYAFENNTHRSNSKAFIAGANFAKQHHKLGK